MPRSTRRDDERPIHNRVRVVRTELAMSRADLAASVGVNPQTIGALERGVAKLAKAIGRWIPGRRRKKAYTA